MNAETMDKKMNGTMDGTVRIDVYRNMTQIDSIMVEKQSDMIMLDCKIQAVDSVVSRFYAQARGSWIDSGDTYLVRKMAVFYKGHPFGTCYHRIRKGEPVPSDADAESDAIARYLDDNIYALADDEDFPAWM